MFLENDLDYIFSSHDIVGGAYAVPPRSASKHWLKYWEQVCFVVYNFSLVLNTQVYLDDASGGDMRNTQTERI